MREEGQKGTELRKEKTREMVVCEREREGGREGERNLCSHPIYL